MRLQSQDWRIIFFLSALTSLLSMGPAMAGLCAVTGNSGNPKCGPTPAPSSTPTPTPTATTVPVPTPKPSQIVEPLIPPICKTETVNHGHYSLACNGHGRSGGAKYPVELYQDTPDGIDQAEKDALVVAWSDCHYQLTIARNNLAEKCAKACPSGSSCGLGGETTVDYWEHKTHRIVCGLAQLTMKQCIEQGATGIMGFASVFKKNTVNCEETKWVCQDPFTGILKTVAPDASLAE